MGHKGRVLLAAILVCLILLPAQAWTEVVEKLGPARFDWQSYILRATGQVEAVSVTAGHNVELRRARLRARQSLWRGLLRVRIQEGQTVQDIVNKRSDMAGTLRGLVHISPIQCSSSGSDANSTTITCQAELNFSGRCASLCIPASMWYTQKSQDTPKVVGTNATTELLPSGIIVDTRALGGKPALICRMYDQQGNLLYGPGLVSRQVGLNQGLVQYASSLQEARQSGRVGQAPLEVPAKALYQNSNSDFVLRREDVASLLTSRGRDVLRQGKVAVVVQTPGGSGLVEFPLEQ